ncbi:metal ABC transporter ATP-binding protein [Paenisporosarcina cavernae]|uniref:ABC transporter ATP-binding protein n=1 Tax=Paenisporosarcina cavernae TaxID=2320858 RepID=A0A385YVQ7_9BACL|nr:ABC transporter ATP-binding protein [Paenisporosarcina cavernae]AYC29593.1 ABC transporter ATP-binding protein [Paenisporosarcina cavernae]
MSSFDIELNQVNYRYEKELVLSNITLRVAKGDFLAILGPNGSGKSTLVKLILGLIKPTSGEIKLFGTPIQQFKKREWIGYVSQKSNAFNQRFPATVFEVVLSGLTKKTGLMKKYPKNKDNLVLQALKSVQMEQFIHQPIGELSGGQQQRIFIARALINEPKLLILDEPTVGVDHENVQSFYNMLEELNKKQEITILLITHDVDTVSNRISHVACLNKMIHFHGYKEEYDAMEEDVRENWYGHSVRKIHHKENVT